MVNVKFRFTLTFSHYQDNKEDNQETVNMRDMVGMVRANDDKTGHGQGMQEMWTTVVKRKKHDSNDMKDTNHEMKHIRLVKDEKKSEKTKKSANKDNERVADMKGKDDVTKDDVTKDVTIDVTKDVTKDDVTKAGNVLFFLCLQTLN